MKRPNLEQALTSVPAPIKRAMLSDHSDLAPGAAAVMGRFFDAVKARREAWNNPGPACFRDAARSESTFRTLLRALTKYAPSVGTDGALPVKREWIAKRPKPPSSKKDPTVGGPRQWPSSWLVYLHGLEQANIRPSSLKRYKASVSRCADAVAQGHAGEELGFLTAYDLAEAFRKEDPDMEKIRPSTIANYLEGLFALGRYGGAGCEALSGIRLVIENLQGQAAEMDKLKQERIKILMDRGGFGYIAEKIAEKRNYGQSLPAHSAARLKSMQAAAVLALNMNKPGRRGDVSNFVVGKDLIRHVDGTWDLRWVQEKTAHETEAGELWPEICQVLDDHILGARPDRLVHMRYQELIGMNWLTLESAARDRRWPSDLVKEAIGVPLHDLRTLAADYLRRHSPDTAANVISAHLGHRSPEASEEYRALCTGEAAARDWAQIRKAIGAERRYP